MEKGENVGCQHFLSFRVVKSHDCVGKGLKVNLFPNKPWFLLVCITSLLKTLWEKEKLLVNVNFSPFPTVFSTLFKAFQPFSSDLKLSSANCFRLEESKICRLGKA